VSGAAVEAAGQESGAAATAAARLPSFGEALRVWLKIGLLSFGGPAGQIALLHRVVVDERRWVSDARFLHAQLGLLPTLGITAAVGLAAG
jgi:chromate transporter